MILLKDEAVSTVRRVGTDSGQHDTIIASQYGHELTCTSETYHFY